MTYFPPSKCAVCGAPLCITRLTCENCKTELSGAFAPCRYCSLSEKQKLFLDTFLKCRGNIKEVERTLALSYPTVKGLLDELLGALFSPAEPAGGKAATTAEILDMLEKGEITADEAARLIQKNSE